MQVAVNKQHVLFGAAHQLDARLSGMHQGAIRRKIIKRHAARGETCLELLSDRAAIQLCKATDCGDSADLIIDNETGQAFIDDLSDRTAVVRDHGRAARHGLDHRKTEGLRPIDRQQ